MIEICTEFNDLVIASERKRKSEANKETDEQEVEEAEEEEEEEEEDSNDERKMLYILWAHNLNNMRGVAFYEF